uniref:Uncharacterized protein n=1 Tax=Rhizophora mucronata TaxID=61149 RepID=A0A2P2QPR8_RHIMU
MYVCIYICMYNLFSSCKMRMRGHFLPQKASGVELSCYFVMGKEDV